MLQIRPATASDLPFILDSWCRSFRDSPYAGVIRNDDFHRVQRSTIAGLLGRGARVLVAAEPTTGRILGWLAHEGTELLHYAYVKRPFRRLGVARRLLEAAGLSRGRYTHRTHCDWLGDRWTWDPVPARIEKLNEASTQVRAD